MVTTHNIANISFDKEFIILTVDGKEIRVNLETISSKLKSATNFQREFFIISPSGYGIHWPLIDEDLSIDALLKTT
ncbi:MAG: DUF2442 domain-containing protein [Flavobacteriales bacterium]|nr:DUF2442 domain-containing protein [Flavobacteriales bacterium]